MFYINALKKWIKSEELKESIIEFVSPFLLIVVLLWLLVIGIKEFIKEALDPAS